MSERSQPTIVSGDGDSIESPIEFTPCDIPTRIAAERQYICERFGPENVGWTRQVHFTRPGFISDWVIELANGTDRSVYFDATVSFDLE